MMCRGANNIVGSGAIQSQSKKLYFAALDGWRFWAALIVVLHHSIRHPYFIEKPLSSFWFITLAMNFFFIMSGFVAAASAKGRQWDFSSTLNYYTARLIRIWPQHFLSLILYLFLISNLRNFSPGIFTANLFLLQGWIPQQSFYFSYNGPSWYLSTWMGLYLMTPFFIRYFKISFMLSLVLPALLFFIVPKNHVMFFFYISPFGNMFKFLSGMLVYQVVSNLMNSHPPQKVILEKQFFLWSVLEIAIVALAVCAPVWCMAPLHAFLMKHLNPGSITWIMHNFPAPLLIAFFVIFSWERGFVSRLLSSKITLVFGKISFILFLWHVIILRIIANYDLFHSIPKQWRLFLYFAISVVLAFPLEYCINSPVTRWLSSFHKKHPLRLEFLRPYVPLVLAIGAVMLYLGCVIPRPTDYTQFIFSSMKTVCDESRYSKVKTRPGNTLLLHPGRKPTSAIFQLNRQIQKFSCIIYTQHEKADVIVKFYLDDKPVKTLRVTGKNHTHKISISCSKAQQLRIEVDKNGTLLCDGTVLKSISFTGYPD